MTKPIRVVQWHSKFAPFYDIYVWGEKYTGSVPASRLNVWIERALTHATITSGASEPLTRTQTCE